jgi:ribonuclease D
MEDKKTKPVRISKDDINRLPVTSFAGKINVITTQDKALEAVIKLNQETIIGFDTETRPSFKKGEFHHVSLLQLNGSKEAFLFRINQFDMPDELLNLLANADIIKVGVAIADDLKGLNKLKPFTPGGFIELADMARDLGIEQFGLRSLAALLMDIRISKGAKLTNWENPHLKKDQLVYAATDSWIGRELYLILRDYNIDEPQIPE